MAEQIYEESLRKARKKKGPLDDFPVGKVLDFSTIAANMPSSGHDGDNNNNATYSRSDEVFGAVDADVDEPAAPAAPRSRDSASESPLRLPDLMDTKWSGGVKGVGRRSKRKTKKVKRDGVGDDDDASVDVVPHGDGAGGAAGVAAFKPVSLAQIRVANFQRNHNVIINKSDEIDLEDTSCESDDSSDVDNDDDDSSNRARNRDNNNNDDDDDEFAVRRQRAAAAASAENDEDPLRDEFDGDAGRDNDLARRLRLKRQSQGKRKRAGSDRVASKMGRMNRCFMCGWGKRSEDSINNEHMAKLRQMLHNNVGEIPKEYIALNMHAYYKNVIRPAAQTRGQMLPVMRSKHFFICITSHNQIPELKLAHDLEVMEIMQNFLERKIAVVPPGAGNEEAPVRQLMKELRETVAIKWRLFGLPMPRMNFHRPERDIKLGSDRQFFNGHKLQKVTAKAGSALAAGGAPKLK